MRVRTKLSLLLSPFLVVAGFCLAAHLACGCAKIDYVPASIDELPRDVVEAARAAGPGVEFSRAVNMVENRTRVLQYRLEGRDDSGESVTVIVYSDRRTQILGSVDAPRLEPVDSSEVLSSAAR